MKKLLSVLFAALLVFLLFAGCAKENKQAVSEVSQNVTQGQNAKPQEVVQEVVSPEADVSKPANDVAPPDAPVKPEENKPTEKPSENPVPSPEAKVSKEEAKEAALKHAGLAENEVKFLKAELDKERKGLVYEVEFNSGNYEYDYEVSAENGKVLKSEKEPERVVEKPSENPVPSPEAKVSKEEAKAAALKHAGLAENEVKFLKAELDKERKGLVYEVEFNSGKYEYDYEVSAETGKVLKSEKEYRD